MLTHCFLVYHLQHHVNPLPSSLSSESLWATWTRCLQHSTNWRNSTPANEWTSSSQHYQQTCQPVNLVISDLSTSEPHHLNTTNRLVNTWWQNLSITKTPVQSTPVQFSPLHSSPVQSTPVQSTPLHSTPVQSSPVQSSPVQSMFRSLQSSPFTRWLHEMPLAFTFSPIVHGYQRQRPPSKSFGTSGYATWFTAGVQSTSLITTSLMTSKLGNYNRQTKTETTSCHEILWAIQWWKPHRCTTTFAKPEITSLMTS